MQRINLLLLSSLLVGHHALAVTLPADPVDSPVWKHRIETIFGKEANIAIAEGVSVSAPDEAEDQFQVPVTVNANGFDLPIDEILIYADLNPIAEVLRFKPLNAEPYLSFRMKVQQATPIRAAIKSGDKWYIASTWVNAAGGGCTAPAAQHALNNWRDRLGETQARYFNQSNKLKFAIQHPMDTGLADGIPEFYIRKLVVYDQERAAKLAELEIYQPVSENPTFSMRPNKDGDNSGFIIEGMDNNGNEIAASVNAH